MLLTMIPHTAQAATTLKVSGATSVYVMKKGTHKQLSANTYVKWKSSNKKVVYCSKHGWIKARKKGKATITVKGAGQTKKIKVIVGTRVKKIRITGSKNIYKGQKVRLKAKASPSNASYKSVTWTSSNKKVAIVSSKGTVKGIKSGSATITAKAKDGSRKYARYKVKVLAAKYTDTQFIAHRGYSSGEPENSIPAFERALNYNFSEVECDIWPTKKDENGDFRMVVSHDQSLERMCNYNADITDMTDEELQERGVKIENGNGISKYGSLEIPYLEDYLDVMQGSDKTAVIELKADDAVKEDSKEYAKKICGIVNDYGMLNDVVFISFSSKYLDYIQDEAAGSYGQSPDTYLLMGSSARGQEKGLIDIAANKNFTGVRAYHGLINDWFTEYARDKGLTVGAWTVDSPTTAYKLVRDYNIDDITTNNVIFD